MAELLSVGLDVGTTSTQLIVSRLTVNNRSSAFAVPEMEIENREILYRSPVHFTPLLEENLVDGDKIRQLVEQEYQNASISRSQVDTGAVIITGETSRKENARAVLSALSEFAGDFVVATAGPALESVLAARGAGAVAYSAQMGKTVFHMDIGGGTANLALIENGKIICTDCLNVGGRLIKIKSGKICYISPVLQDICPLKIGDSADLDALEKVAQTLTHALEMAAGLQSSTDLLARLRTAELGVHPGCTVQNAVISFSGGVADCIDTVREPFEFGDIGPLLGQCIRKSRLCQGQYRLGAETIRATVIGAGCHSAQLSGSTVFLQNIPLPLKNCPVLAFENHHLTAESIRQKLATQESVPVIAFPGEIAPDYGTVKTLAGILAQVLPSPILIGVETDMAKALGQAIALLRPGDGILCIDRVRLKDGDFLDIGSPVGPALPVVVKTLILEK